MAIGPCAQYIDSLIDNYCSLQYKQVVINFFLFH